MRNGRTAWLGALLLIASGGVAAAQEKPQPVKPATEKPASKDAAKEADDEEDTPMSIFHPTYLVLMAGVSNAFLAGDLFNLFVGFEILLFASYVLLTLGGTGPRIHAGTTYVVVSLVSSALFLYGPKTKTMSVLFFDLTEGGNFERLAALGVILLVTTMTFVILGLKVAGRDFLLRESA